MLTPDQRRHRAPGHDLSEGQFDVLLRTTSRLALLMLGMFALVLALQAAQSILAPVSLAIILGLVFGPVAERLEARGIPPAASAGMLVVLLVCVIATAVLLLSVPLSEWIGRAPAIWAKMQTELRNWQGPLQAIASMQDQIKGALGNNGALEVTVQDGNQVLDVALLAPQIGGDILIFLVSLYFYLATRDSVRLSILSLFVTRRMRWRIAHVFSDVEGKVSRYLLSVTMLNVCVAIAMTIITWGLGLPSPLLWGVMAGVLNYIPYVGQACMIGILLAVGFATQTDLPHILAPVGCYLVVNLIEGQLVFPQFVGHQMTVNPFLIFLSIIFWIWIWGPFGSLFAVPMLLVLQSLASNVLPGKEVKPHRPVRRTANMSDKDMVLANAARAIKEKAEEEAAAATAVEAAKAEADLAKAQAERAEKEKQAAERQAAAEAEAKPVRRRTGKGRPPKPAVAT